MRCERRGKILGLPLAVLLVLGSSFDKPVSAQATLEQMGTIFVEMSPSPIMKDWSGVPTLFKNDPVPVHVVIDVRSSPTYPTVEFENLDWTKFFTALRVSLKVDDKDVNEQRIETNVQLQRQSGQICGLLTISVKDGWPQGQALINTSLNVRWLKQENLPTPVVLGDASQIRFTIRAKSGRDDELLRRRYEYVRNINLTGRPCLPVSAERAVKALHELLKAFPDDPFGQAHLGRMAELQKKPQLAANHYRKVIKTIVRTLPLRSKHTISPPVGSPESRRGYTEPTPEFRALHFNSWMGASGPVQLLKYFNRKIFLLEKRAAASRKATP